MRKCASPAFGRCRRDITRMIAGRSVRARVETRARCSVCSVFTKGALPNDLGSWFLEAVLTRSHRRSGQCTGRAAGAR
jgi:hypothetical protein